MTEYYKSSYACVRRIALKPITIIKGYIHACGESYLHKVYCEVVQYPCSTYFELRIFKTVEIGFNWNIAFSMCDAIEFKPSYVAFGFYAPADGQNYDPDKEIYKPIHLNVFLSKINFKFNS